MGSEKLTAEELRALAVHVGAYLPNLARLLDEHASLKRELAELREAARDTRMLDEHQMSAVVAAYEDTQRQVELSTPTRADRGYEPLTDAELERVRAQVGGVDHRGTRAGKRTTIVCARIVVLEHASLERELAELRAQVAGLIEDLECSCITPAEDCDCSGCLAASARADAENEAALLPAASEPAKEPSDG